MNPPNMKPNINVGGNILRPKVRATIFDKDWYLLLCRVPGHCGVTWQIPGGGIDSGESPLDALAREVWEETGLTKFIQLGLTDSPTREVWDVGMKASSSSSYDGQLISEYVLQIGLSKPELRPGVANEVSALKWVESSEVKRFLNYRDQYEVFERVCTEVLGSIPKTTIVKR